MGLFQDKAIFSYVRCKVCGLLYAPIFFDEAQLVQLYGDMPPNMNVVPEHALRLTQKSYFAHLRNALPSCVGGYIEVGPDVGLFTENCAGLDVFSHYWLFEPNESVVPRLETLMDGYGYDIITSIGDFSAVPNGSVCACVMVHVLDHLLDPVKALAELRAKMKNGSVMLVVTHDERSLLARFIKSSWPAYSIQHPQLFNRRSIQRLFEVSGFRVINQAKSTNFFPLRFLAQNFLWSFGIRAKTLRLVPETLVGLKLGNILSLVTPK